MQEIAAYLLLKIAGKSGTSDEITAVVSAGGGSVNEEALSTLVSDVEGKDINELLKTGMEKLKDVPMGGGGGGGGAAGGDGGGDAVEEEKEEVEEEEIDFGGGMDMFGGEEGGGDY